MQITFHKFTNFQIDDVVDTTQDASHSVQTTSFTSKRGFLTRLPLSYLSYELIVDKKIFRGWAWVHDPSAAVTAGPKLGMADGRKVG